jgi:hypothetical protein
LVSGGSQVRPNLSIVSGLQLFQRCASFPLLLSEELGRFMSGLEAQGASGLDVMNTDGIPFCASALGLSVESWRVKPLVAFLVPELADSLDILGRLPFCHV